MSAAAAKAVFLSYASQDAEAARNICDALRGAGVEVWFDQSELRGGDAWDAKIRKQIKECALFVPVISANTQARREGYFRIEWKLAAQRTHAIAEGTPFLLPVLFGEVAETEALVPAEFREVQWTRLRAGDGGQAPNHDGVAAFSARVASLLDGGTVTPSPHGSAGSRHPSFKSRRRKWPAFAVATAVVGLAIVAMLRPWAGRGDAPAERGPKAEPTAATEVQRLLAQVAAIDAKEADATEAEWNLAETLAAQATKLEPANAEAWAWYSHTAIGQLITGGLELDEAFATASQRARQAVALSAQSLEAQLALARAYVLEPKTRAEAASILAHLTQTKPQERRAWRGRGTVARMLGRHDDALAFYAKADALPGGDAAACREQATLLCGLGRLDEAERAIERAIAVRPGPAGHLLKIQFLVQIRGDLAQAGALLDKLPGSYFTRDDVVLAAVQLWRWQREPAKIVRLLTAWPEAHVGLAPRDYLLGEAYHQMGRPEAAVQSWRAAVAIVDKEIAQNKTTDPLLYHIKARFLARLGEKAAAEEAMRLWEQADPNKVGAWNKAHLLVLLGRNDEALAALPRQPWTGLSADVRFLYRLSGGAEYRYDPLWDPLRGEERFEAVIDAYRRRLGPPAATAAAPATVTAAKTVAVLAFENLSDDKANEYFSDGISEELINTLGRVPGLTVKGRTSAFYFKDKKNLSSAEIAGQLGVAYLVRGGVRKSGGKVRITAELTRAATDELIWSSDPLERKTDDAFAVQEEIAALIAQNLQLKLGVSAGSKSGVNGEAYQLYLQGRDQWRRRTPEAYRQAEELFGSALRLSPSFARAHVGLADVWMVRGLDDAAIGGFTQRDSPVLKKSQAAVQRALDLEPGLAEAHTSFGNTRWIEWKLDDAVRELRLALSLNPNYATAHHWMGRIRISNGELDEALAALKRAHELEPLAHRIADNYAFVLLLAQRHEEALMLAGRALALEPGSMQALRFKALALVELARTGEALAVIRQYLAGNFEADNGIHAAIYVLARAGRRAEAEQLLAQCAQRVAASGKIRPEITRLVALMALGRTDDVLATLEPERTSSGGVDELYFWPALDPIRDHPRFVAFLETLGVTEAHARAQAWRAANPPQKVPAKK